MNGGILARKRESIDGEENNKTMTTLWGPRSTRTRTMNLGFFTVALERAVDVDD